MALWSRSSQTGFSPGRSEEHTSELQSQSNIVCRLLLEKKKKYAPSLQDYNGAGIVKALVFNNIYAAVYHLRFDSRINVVGVLVLSEVCSVYVATRAMID